MKLIRAISEKGEREREIKKERNLEWKTDRFSSRFYFFATMLRRRVVSRAFPLVRKPLTNGPSSFIVVQLDDQRPLLSYARTIRTM